MVERVLVSGRRPEAAQQVAAAAGGDATTVEQLLDAADVVLTATASRAPLFESSRPDGAVTVADLTGVGVVDAAVAEAVCSAVAGGL